MVGIRRKKNVNVMRIGIKVVSTVIALYAAGLMLSVIGGVMNQTSSAFYDGLTLIGWTISDSANGTSASCGLNNVTFFPGNVGGINNCITGTNGTGILSVIGLLAIVWVVFEFVDIV